MYFIKDLPENIKTHEKTNSLCNKFKISYKLKVFVLVSSNKFFWKYLYSYLYLLIFFSKVFVFVFVFVFALKKAQMYISGLGCEKLTIA